MENQGWDSSYYAIFFSYLQAYLWTWWTTLYIFLFFCLTAVRMHCWRICFKLRNHFYIIHWKVQIKEKFSSFPRDGFTFSFSQYKGCLIWWKNLISMEFKCKRLSFETDVVTGRLVCRGSFHNNLPRFLLGCSVVKGEWAG